MRLTHNGRRLLMPVAVAFVRLGWRRGEQRRQAPEHDGIIEPGRYPLGSG